MLQRHFRCFGTIALLCFVLLPLQSTALIEDALDIIHVVKEVATGVLKAWDIVQQSPLGEQIEFPLMREKQRKVLLRLKEVSRQIEQTEERYADNVAHAIESIHEFVAQKTPLMTKVNEISDTMNSITTRFEQMRKYEKHQDKLETTTLITFAEWTVSPNAYSVNHLMERLHLTILGSPEKSSTDASNNLLSQLVDNYEVT